MSDYWQLFCDNTRGVISRFKTFTGWSIRHPTLPSAKKFAAAGLLYDDSKKILVCTTCNKITGLDVFYDKEEEEEEEEEEGGRYGGSTVVTLEDLHYVGCCADKDPFVAPSIEALVKATPMPRFNEYRTFESRLKSFANSTVTKISAPGLDATNSIVIDFYNVKVDASKLASAGLFRLPTLTEYIVQCFACGLYLVYWDFKVDDPIEEHAKYNPQCPYLRLCVSIPYLRKVASTYRNSDLFWLIEYTRDSDFLVTHYSPKIINALTLSKFDLNAPEKMNAFLSDYDRFLRDCEENDGKPYPPRLNAETYCMLSSSSSSSEPKDEEEENEGGDRPRNMCVVCVCMPATIVFLPCAHATVCLNCLFASPNLDKELKCYVCQQEVVELFRIEIN